MNIESTNKNDENSVEKRLKEVSDQEIISILRFRDQFTPEARDFAINEAIKREIIKSTDDLNNEEFQVQALAPRSLFPIGTTKMQSIAILKSLCRIFYGFGLLPIILGIVQINSHNYIAAVLPILIGITVIYLSYRLDRTFKPFLANILLLFNIPAIGFALYYLKSTGNPSTMDVAAVAIVVIVMLYTTFYANKLAAYFNKDEAKE